MSFITPSRSRLYLTLLFSLTTGIAFGALQWFPTVFAHSALSQLTHGLPAIAGAPTLNKGPKPGLDSALTQAFAKVSPAIGQAFAPVELEFNAIQQPRNSSLGWRAQAAGCNSYTQQTKLAAGDGELNDLLGNAVAISGDTAVLGAPWDRIGTNDRQGSVYVFVRNGTNWTFQQKLTAQDGAFDDRFGAAVAISGDTIIVGADLAEIGINANQGAAYVFQRTGISWNQTQKLVAFDGNRFDEFGYAVAIHNDDLLVGAIDNADEPQGSVYAYTRVNGSWNLLQKLNPSDLQPGFGYGTGVVMDNGTALISATGDNTGTGFGHGSLYIWVRTEAGWSLQQKLRAPSGIYFGRQVALSGETAAVRGAFNVEVTSGREASVYVFVRTGTVWNLQQNVLPTGPSATSDFGSSLALNGDTLFVSAPLVGYSTVTRGLVHVYRRTGANWNELQLLTTNEGYGFGTPFLASGGNTVLIGVPGDNFGRGATYVFVCNPCPAVALAPLLIPNPKTGNFYSQSLTASGGTAPYSFALMTGSLPPGMSLSPDGILSGTPTVPGPSYYSITVRATDANGCAGLWVYQFEVEPQCQTITINPTTLPTGQVDIGYINGFSALGAFSPLTYTVSAGALPPGLFLSDNYIVGLPAAPGTFNFTVQVTDRYGCVGSRNYSLVILAACPNIILNVPPPSLTGDIDLPFGIRNTPYSYTATQTGASAPVTWAISFSSLPAGLALNPNTGVISGVPTSLGYHGFRLEVTDVNGCVAVKFVRLLIKGLASPPVKGDFDGDRKTDLGVWRGSNGNWLTLNSSTGNPQTVPWGAGYAPYNDVIVPGDYDGDGKTDQAIWRGADSIWYIRKSSDGGYILDLWGANYAPYNDIPVPGDYDGDGKTDLAVWRPNGGYWHIKRSSDGSIRSEDFGQPGDVPVPADYDGDGITDLAFWRGSIGTWFIRQSNGFSTAIGWGAGYAPYFDVPVPADYDGDGKADLAIWRGANSIWYIRPSASPGNPILELWGANYAPYNDVPVPGDYDGDGKADIAVFRRTGTWYIKRSSNGTNLIQVQGQSGDTPVPAQGVR